MQEAIQVAIGLATVVASFLLGAVWRTWKRSVAFYRARRFWRPVMSSDVQVVLGRFRDLPGFEASGVIGAGDALALKELTDYFGRIGFRSFGVSYNDQLGHNDPSGDSLRTSLILLGGPDANSLTREVIDRLDIGIEFVEIDRRDAIREVADRAKSPPGPADRPRPRASRFPSRLVSVIKMRPGFAWRIPAFWDKRESKMYQPIVEGELVRTDYGIIIRAPNPFNLEKTVVILCGCYGYGTWAAVRFSQTKRFLARIPSGDPNVECLIAVDVVRESPQNERMQFIRSAFPTAGR